MAWELIYTSAPRGLKAGASGYCTVAQTVGLREDLAAALERRSLFAHEPRDESPVYFSFRNLPVGGEVWRVLTRALDAGLDFTGRRHFLAHHLVLEPQDEPSGIQPAEFLLGWKGWRNQWDGSPQELAKIRIEDLWGGVSRIRLPAREWKRVTGDAGWAVQPHRLASPVGWLSSELSTEELLRLMGESTALLEATQRGKSWLVPLEVGGPANPVVKDSLWSGRVSWFQSTVPVGVRSGLRIESCRGPVPAGREEEILLARTGEGPQTPPKRETVSVVAASPGGPGEVHAGSGAVAERSLRWWVFAGAGLTVLLGAGFGWWMLPRSARVPAGSVARTDPTGVVPIPVSPVVPPHPERTGPAPVRVLAGQALRESLWADAGGEEPVRGLHLLFGKPSAAGVIEDEVALLLREGADPFSVRGPEGMISLAAGEPRKKFCREASKRTGPWTVFVPETHRGLAYLPDPAEGRGSRRLRAQGLSPQEILEEIGREIFLTEDRWSLLICFPSWGEKQFLPVRVVGGEEDRGWLKGLDQHRNQLQQMRRETLDKLTPWLGPDPGPWDDEKIRTIARQVPRGPASGIFKEFKQLDDEIRKWWLPPEGGVPGGVIFQKLLEHPGMVCELQLDELVIGRIVP